MKAFATFLFTLTLALAASAASANLLSNPGFESDIVYDAVPPDNWLGFSNPGVGVPVENFGVFSSTNNPRTGEQSLEVYISDFSGTFVGALQQVTGLTSGLAATFSGWIAGTSEGGSAAPGLEIRIEWIDFASGQEIARTGNLTPTPGDTYEFFSLTDIVPAGADAATLVFVLESFTGPANLQVAFLDDTEFSVAPIPIPAVAFLFPAGLIAGLGWMRRQAG